jgi:hypothetical protein
MQSSSSSYDSTYNNNLNTIINFASEPDDSSAGLKSDAGVLSVVRGWDFLSKGLYLIKKGFGSHLQETATEIDNVSNKTINRVESELNELEEDLKGILKGDKKPDEVKQKLATLREHITQELSMLDGLNRIKAVYQKKYENDPGNQGVQDLKKTCESSEKQVKKQSAKFIESLDEIKRKIEKISLEKSFVNLQKIEDLGEEKDPAVSLEGFCQKYCVGISYSDAQKQVLVGKRLMGEILKGNKDPPKNIEESKKELRALSWFLMSCAIQKGQGHQEGAFIIEDPHKYFYDYLCKSPEVNTRDSTHLSGRTPTKQHGVDVLEGMPANKRTILFEMADNPTFRDDLPSQVLFLKLENYSPFATTAYGYDIVMHGVELIAAQYNKKFNPGFDDQPTMRKERVPAEAVRNFNELIDIIQEDAILSEKFQDPTGSPLNLKEAKANAKKWGIGYIHLFLNEVKKIHATLVFYPEDLDTKMDLLEEAISTMDHPDRRTGREVYLTESDLSYAITK